ncbi:MAG TPA: phosphate acyltransferase PlsX [Bacteroidales bacterium]|nr:phosphate acyltransferase PlsX [Bacteroidales bacterium]
MKLGIDAMGGDFAPVAVVNGAIKARQELPEEVELVLIGDSAQIREICKEHHFDAGRFTIVHTTEVIEMGENPAKAFAQKKDSSIFRGFALLRQGDLDAFASAGNTGAMLAGAMLVSKVIPGIIRPVISAHVPTPEGKPIVLLDVGLNPDARPDVLYQYGILGSVYARAVLEIENPKVGLLNIGSEEEKGNMVTKETYKLMKDTTQFQFVGNVEGHDFFNSEKQNVIVCDAFVGNILLKEAEAFYGLVKKLGIHHPFFEEFNFENTGGTPVLGINHPVVIGHGISNAEAIKNMIINTYHVVNSQLVEKIKEAFQ